MLLIAWVSVLCNNSVDFADFSCHITKMIGRAQTNLKSLNLGWHPNNQ